jgi:hypothetical protein
MKGSMLRTTGNRVMNKVVFSPIAGTFFDLTPGWPGLSIAFCRLLTIYEMLL